MTGSQILELHCSLSFRLPNIHPSNVGGMFIIHRFLHGSVFPFVSDPENAEFLGGSSVQTQVWAKGASCHLSFHSINARRSTATVRARLCTYLASIIQTLFVQKILA